MPEVIDTIVSKLEVFGKNAVIYESDFVEFDSVGFVRELENQGKLRRFACGWRITGKFFGNRNS